MNNYTIYMHKNKINGKIYIGQTCQKPEYRWKNGKGYIECPHFYSAILKYGWDNFEHIILKEKISLEEANYWEEYYIEKYKSTEENFGYNISKGGLNRTFSDETRKKLSFNMKKRWQNKDFKLFMSKRTKELWKNEEYVEKQRKAREDKIHYISEEGKRRISEARKKYILEHGTPTQGKGHSKETKEKLRKSKLGKNNPMYGTHHTEEWKQNMKIKLGQSIQCIETNQIFSNYSEAAKWCGLKSTSGISDCIAGRKKSAGKHPETGEKLHWKKV